MPRDFEDHCWKDVVSAQALEIYAAYARELRSASGRHCSRSTSITSSMRAGRARWPSSSRTNGTPLLAHLNRLGVRSLIVCGESTSGCVRASVVDGYSNGYHVTLVEECVYDRHPLSHKVNLFDMHHKYADVMALEDVLLELHRLPIAR